MKTLDCLGEICPVPAMRLKQALLKAKPGDTFMIITDHSCVPTSIQGYCTLKGHACLCEEVMNGVWELSITVSPEQKP